MITTDAALYSPEYVSALRDERRMPLAVCSCGQDLGSGHREHCPRCGCCLN